MNATPPAELPDAVYRRLSELVRARTGLWFGPSRRAALAAGVAAARGATPLNAYVLSLAETPTDTPVWDGLLRELTVGETYFFREPEQMAALRERIFPELIARRRPARSLNLWSAGCATGEEPYTLAMMLRDLLPDCDAWRVRLLATDINRQALAQAAAARYRAWSFRQMPPAQRQRFFAEQDGVFELDPQLRRAVKFRYLNLAEAVYPASTNDTAGLDLILCRNVMLYLPEDLIRVVTARFLQCLAPGGWLVVAPSEANDALYPGFEPVQLMGTSVYRRPAAPPAASASLPRHFPENGPPRRGPAAGWEAPGERPTPRVPPAPPAPPAHSPAEVCADAASLLRARRRTEARRVLQAAPPHPLINSLLARLEADAGRLAEARVRAEQALEVDPLQREARYVLALIQQEQGDFEAAREHYRQVLYLDPDFALGHYQLAVLLRRLGRLAEAERHWRRAAHLAAELPADSVLPGAEDLTAGALVAQLRTAGGRG